MVLTWWEAVLWAWMIFILGGLVGVGLAGVCVAAGRTDEAMERDMRARKR
jgi:hypothetical protein